MRIISRVIPGAKKVDVREWVPPPCHCEKRSDEAIPHPASASTFPGGRLRRRFASRNDRYLAQLAAGESIIRAPGITPPGLVLLPWAHVRPAGEIRGCGPDAALRKCARAC